MTPHPERLARSSILLAALFALALTGAACDGSGGSPDGAPGCYRCDVADADARDTGGGPGPADTGGEDAPPPPPVCDLPVIAVDIDDAAWRRLHDDPEAFGEVEVGATLFGQRFEGAALEVHGGYARQVPKLSYRLRLPKDADGKDPRFDLFGAGPEPIRRIVLQSSWIDPTFVRGVLVFERLRSLGGLAPRVSFVELHFNGEPWGVYQAVERLDALWMRKQGFNPDGNLYKAENHQANWAAKPNPLDGYDKQSGEDQPSDDLRDLLVALTDTPARHEDFEREVAPRLSLADHRAWTAVHVFGLNQDTYTKNYYLYHDPEAPPGTPSARFRIVSWDADATFGISWDATRIAADDPRWYGTDRFSPRLYSIAEYRRAYLEALRDALDAGPLMLAALLARTAGWRARLRVCGAEDLARWERPLDWDEEYDYLDASIRARHTVLRATVATLLGEAP
jgi:hypothetical protein